ncbi:MAG: hypothetical protein KC620_16040, partial [Myxococcales bacterium]|nr:hypothetical protein [Myxococcales bacterium]
MIARRLALLLVLLASVCAHAARVVDARLEGMPAESRFEAERVLAGLIGGPDDATAIAAAIRGLEGLHGIGSLRLRTEPQGPGVALIFTHDGRPRRVADVRFVIDGRTLDPAASWRTLRRVQAGAPEGLFLASGERHHPALQTLDQAAIEAWYQDSGHRDAHVELTALEADDLVTIEVRVDRGPLYRVEKVEIRGIAGGVPELQTQAGERLSQRALNADRATLARGQCRAGHPRATVAVETHAAAAADTKARPVRVVFAVEPGPFVRTGRVQITGRFVPYDLLTTLPLREGAPYCPDALDAARAQLARYLADRGVPDPRIAVHSRTRLLPDGQRIENVTFDVRALADARVERIWFSGNRVTREDVLRQMCALHEGELYRQGAVDSTVQALRRSGLFREVVAMVFEGSAPDRAFVTFRVVEREALSFDVLEARLILRNVDLGAWPDDFAAFEQGRAFRGAGQRLDLVGQPDLQAIDWRDDFVARHFIARAAFSRATASTPGFESQTLTLTAGLGVKGLEGGASALIFGELEWASVDRKADLPVLDGDRLTGAGGLEMRADLTRRDDERVQYLGLELSVASRTGEALAGEALGWVDGTAFLRVHVPVWATERGQHFVLRLSVRPRAVWVFDGDDAALPPHRRLFPTARGYGGTSVGLPFDVDGDAQRLGGRFAADA